MIDSVVDMLGPATDMITEVMQKLGSRHAKYGVQTEFLGAMGQALLGAMKETLSEDDWTPDVERAWQTVYNDISSDMATAIQSA